MKRFSYNKFLMNKKYFALIALFFLLFCWTAIAQKATSINIKVEGLPDPVKAKIATMLANRSQNIPLPLTEASVQRFYRQSPNHIRASLQAYGYFKPQITSQIHLVANTWNITYTIAPGPVVKVIHVDVKIVGEGNQDPAFKNLIKNLPVQVGQQLDVEKYQESKDALFNLSSSHGYFDAKMVLSQIILNVEHQQASIVLHFDTGKRYRFGATLFPPTDLNLEFLERYLRYNMGDYYNSALLQKTQQALAGSGYFSQSVVTPLTTDAENLQVPIKVDLTPVKPRRYTFGLGYGTDTGPRGTFGFNWIPINQYGHHLNMMARGSYLDVKGQTRQNSYANMSYIIPGKDPANDSYAITTGYGIINQDTGNANSFKTSLSYNTVLNPDWQQVIALNYLNERYDLPNTPRTNASVIYANGHWQYIHNRALQNEKIITRGISASFDLAGGPDAQALGSKTTFIQGKAGLKALTTIEQTHTRLLFRSQVGHTEIHNLDNLPLTLQLVTGGPTTIRGFSYNSIGPGRNLIILSGEVQQRVHGNWYIAGFVDSGAVTNNDFTTLARNSGDYKVGAGAGVVYLTPIGAVELAMARPVLNGGKTWQLEFSVGAEL